MRRLALLCLLALAACRTRTVHERPLPPDATFGERPATGAERARWDEAAAWSEAQGGLALVVVRGNDVVYERYAPGFGPERPRHLFSGTKSFGCALAAAAVEDGLLALDEPAARTLVEWASDPRKSRITIRQLLHFTSGLDPAFRLTLDALAEPQRVHDKYLAAVALDADEEPGASFRYGNSHLLAFGELLRRKTGDVDAYLRRRVLGPLGLRTAGWLHDPAGNPMLPFGAFTTAREWAKYGVFLRDEGRFGGRQLLPAASIRACREGSAQNPGYGITLWLNRPVPVELVGVLPTLRDGSAAGLLLPGGPPDLFGAGGYKGQRLYVVPSEDLVIARLADDGPGFTDGAFLAKVFPTASASAP